MKHHFRVERWRDHPVCWRECDVLIIGGGIAGLMAARAAAPHARTLVVAKGFAGADGVSPFAGGVVIYLRPEDDWEAFWAEHARLSEGLAHPEAVRRTIETTACLIEQLAAKGAPVERSEDGSLRRRWIPAAGRRHVPRLGLSSVEFARFLRQEALRAGTRILDQTVILKLRSAREGGFWALGIRRQQGVLVALRARAVVLAAGGCAWRGAHMGLHSAMGEGLTLGLEAGAELAGMEFCTSYLATCALFDTHGQDVLMGLGGRLRNRWGEDILARHGFPCPAPPHLTALAMLSELRAGHDPIVMDLRGIPARARQEWEHQFPLVARGLHRTGVDVFKEPVPWIPGFIGSIAGGGGIYIRNLAGATGVPGLFAAGDTATRLPLVGAGSGITFLNLAWALASGHWAGQAAAHTVERVEPGNGVWEEEVLTPSLHAMLAPLDSSDSEQSRASLDDVLKSLQRFVADPAYNFFRTASGLAEADAGAAALWERLHAIRVGNWHDLVRWHELRSAIQIARAVFQSARARPETRGWHRRLDHPQPDPQYEDTWLIAWPEKHAASPSFVITPMSLSDPQTFQIWTP
ncbi:FAD-binding protein [Thermoflexus sp.]|uniref:FAD-binding protein n=1 Tax=Thermoflexus sp. TaxID=1969742 RepID=UPI0025F83459|nr:FAD-binding protein [Thermoflexus sp.]MCS6965033.1 FAD-binding protein [Thermoflexus sp.]MCS7351759.1 FAD-binding protein [Thermoflexus sp.]MCX7691092.1 FAD-binding protein [Thermoflexus sp.]MDW8181218.1 FAD-binding protein [Anaerolineae bacterium]